MLNRRNFLKTSALGASAMAFAPGFNVLQAKDINLGRPKRFIFIRKSNGLRPKEVALPTFNDAQKKQEANKEAFEADLDKHDLPDWLNALSKYKANMSILQGLSSKMM